MGKFDWENFGNQAGESRHKQTQMYRSPIGLLNGVKKSVEFCWLVGLECSEEVLVLSRVRCVSSDWRKESEFLERVFPCGLSVVGFVVVCVEGENKEQELLNRWKSFKGNFSLFGRKVLAGCLCEGELSFFELVEGVKLVEVKVEEGKDLFDRFASETVMLHSEVELTINFARNVAWFGLSFEAGRFEEELGRALEEKASLFASSDSSFYFPQSPNQTLVTWARWGCWRWLTRQRLGGAV